MPALRCPVCLVDWPNDQKLYHPCPECGEKTALFWNATAMDAGEAVSRRNHALFGRWCEERGRAA